MLAETHRSIRTQSDNPGTEVVAPRRSFRQEPPLSPSLTNGPSCEPPTVPHRRFLPGPAGASADRYGWADFLLPTIFRDPGTVVGSPNPLLIDRAPSDVVSIFSLLVRVKGLLDMTSTWTHLSRKSLLWCFVRHISLENTSPKPGFVGPHLCGTRIVESLSFFRGQVSAYKQDYFVLVLTSRPAKYRGVTGTEKLGRWKHGRPK